MTDKHARVREAAIKLTTNISDTLLSVVAVYGLPIDAYEQLIRDLVSHATEYGNEMLCIMGDTIISEIIKEDNNV